MEDEIFEEREYKIWRINERSMTNKDRAWRKRQTHSFPKIVEEE